MRWRRSTGRARSREQRCGQTSRPVALELFLQKRQCPPCHFCGVPQAVGILRAAPQEVPQQRVGFVAGLAAIPMEWFAGVMLFVAVHVLMVVKSGFRRQMRAMTVGGMPQPVSLTISATYWPGGRCAGLR